MDYKEKYKEWLEDGTLVYAESVALVGYKNHLFKSRGCTERTDIKFI